MSRALATTPPLGRRPGIVRVVVWTFAAVAAGGLAASFGLLAIGALTASVAVPALGQLPFVADTRGAVVADVAYVSVYGLVLLPVLRGALAWTTDRMPATTWLVLSLVAGASLALTLGSVSAAGGVLVTGLLVRVLAYGPDGSPRPEPFAMEARTAIALSLAVTLAALGVLVGYAVMHPLRSPSIQGRAPITRGHGPVTVPGPPLQNTGHRALRVLAVEPGHERGYALHLVGAAVQRPTWNVGEPSTTPLRAVTLAPGRELENLSLVLSRAGCRSGRTGRIDSVRVVYDVGGRRTTDTIPLHDAPTLTC